MYRPLNEFTKQTDELKKLISKYPGYPITVLCGNEVCAGDDYCYYYAPCLSFGIGEILDCEQDVDEGIVFTDREEFRERVEYILEDEYEDDEFDKAVEAKLAEYDPYWKKVIWIKADV